MLVYQRVSLEIWIESDLVREKKITTSRGTSPGIAGMGPVVGGLIRGGVAVDVMTLYEISTLSNSLW